MPIIKSLCLLLFSTQILATEPQLEPVKLQLKWFHAFQFAGYYAAKQQGYYADEGLDVQFIERSINKPVVQEVVSGQANYGIENSGILIQYASGTPIKALAAIFQNTALIFISKQSSGIIAPEGMKGKRIMMFDGGDGGDEAPLRALLNDAQLTKQQYTLIPQTFDNDALIDDKTDVISSYITDQPFYFRNKGVKINIINPQSYGFNFYGDLLFTSQVELNNYPGRAKRFQRASIKGWHYALNHKEELIQLIHTQYHSKSSLEHLRYEAKETSKLIAADSIPIGEIKPPRLQRIAKIYHDLNLVKKLSKAELRNFIYDQQVDLGLTPEEELWLENHPVIRLGIDNNFAPHEWIDKEGNYVGHSADYIKLIEQRLNIKFDIIKDKSWIDVLAMAKQGSLDMLADANNTSQRLEYLHFTDSYNETPTIIISNTSHSYLGTIENLPNRTVAIEKAYAANNFLRKNYPTIKILSVDNTLEALRQVSKGKADAYIGDAASANYAINQSGLLNLQFSGQTDYINQHSMAVIKSQPILFSIIKKTLASITQKERNEISNRWLNLKIESGIKTETLFKYGLSALILLLLFAYWILRLRQEIAKRQLNEKILKETESRFTNSQHLANFGVWDWNIQSNSLYWSDTVAPLFGYKTGRIEASYQKFLDIVHPDDRKKVTDAIQACLKFDQPYNLEHRVVWADQSTHWVHEAGNVIRDQQDKPIQMLGTVRDITDKKNAEDALKHHRDTLQEEVKRQTYSLEQAKNEAEKANRIKSEFLANMSHELRTPMHGILSFARLGIKNVKTAKVESLARYFDRINISGERLLVLLDGLLDLSKLEMGKMEVDKKRCDLHKLVNQCIAEQQSWLNEKQLKISWQQVCDSPIALFDSARISQVMANLLSNSIKFSEQGKTIYLSITDAQLNNQPALLFTLRDEGIGIPEQELGTVFDKFIQSSKTSTGAGGTGLGLAICMEIINIHQGKIWAEQSKTCGAVFKFIIPV